MTIHHRYSLLPQADGRPPKPTAAEEVWKLASHRKAAPMWVACAVLIAFLVFMPSFSNEPAIKFGTEERPVAVSPSKQMTTSPRPRDVPTPGDVTTSSVNATALIDFSVGGCNIWRGDWIPYPGSPPYTNATCSHIQDNQNCMKLGRPDRIYLHWRWKPHDCELPFFDATDFFKIVAGKKMIFIGDSLARNSFQSVLCHLARVEEPDSSKDGGVGTVRWYFRSHNFTFDIVWAPFFVKGDESAVISGKNVAQLYLDEVDESWGSRLNDYDYVVLSGGRWFERPSVYYVQKKLVGHTACPTTNTEDIGFAYAYSVALRTVFDLLISSHYKGVVLFRTFSPEHWENGSWDQGGTCTKKIPFKSKSTPLDRLSKIMYSVQVEQFGKLLQRSAEYSFKLKIVDTMHSAILRPDSHPGPYGLFHPKAKYDCVHWCLPGAVDVWTDMILQVLKHL